MFFITLTLQQPHFAGLFTCLLAVSPLEHKVLKGSHLCLVHSCPLWAVSRPLAYTWCSMSVSRMNTNKRLRFFPATLLGEAVKVGGGVARTEVPVLAQAPMPLAAGPGTWSQEVPVIGTEHHRTETHSTGRRAHGLCVTPLLPCANVHSRPHPGLWRDRGTAAWLLGP